MASLKPSRAHLEPRPGIADVNILRRHTLFFHIGKAKVGKEFQANLFLWQFGET
jgi:hypothetical protein